VQCPQVDDVANNGVSTNQGSASACVTSCFTLEEQASDGVGGVCQSPLIVEGVSQSALRQALDAFEEAEAGEIVCDEVPEQVAVEAFKFDQHACLTAAPGQGKGFSPSEDPRRPAEAIVETPASIVFGNRPRFATRDGGLQEPRISSGALQSNARDLKTEFAFVPPSLLQALLAHYQSVAKLRSILSQDWVPEWKNGHPRLTVWQQASDRLLEGPVGITTLIFKE